MKNMRGFTLIEVMIVVAIIAILASIAFPAYQESVRKGKRSDGQGALMGLASAMERYYTENNTYVGATLGSGGIFNSTVPVDGGAPYYNLAISTATATAYTLTAAGTGSMADDNKCGSLTINNIGVQGISGSGAVNDCWK